MNKLYLLNCIIVFNEHVLVDSYFSSNVFFIIGLAGRVALKQAIDMSNLQRYLFDALSFANNSSHSTLVT